MASEQGLYVFSPYNLLLSHVINLLFLFICIVFVLGQVQACD